MAQEGKNRRRTGLLCMVIFGAGMLAWLACTVRSENVKFNNEPVYELTGTWKAEAGGAVREVELPAKVDAKVGERVVFTKTLEEKETICNSILFHSGHQYVRVYLDGDLIWEYGYQQKKPVAMSPGAPWQYMRLPAQWEGKELAIETVSVYGQEAGSQDRVYLGTKAGLLFMVVKQAAPSLLLTVPVLLAGLVVLCAGLFFRQKETASKMLRLGCFTLVTGLWILMESRVTQLFTGKVLLCMNLLFLLFGLVPVFLLYYLLAFPIFVKSRYMRGVFWLSAGNYGVILLLNLTGRADFMHTVPLTHLVMILGAAGIAAVYIREKAGRRKLDVQTRDLFIAILLLVGFGLLDILRFYLGGMNEAIVCTRVGLFCFVAVLGVSAARQESREQMLRLEQKVLQKLAYTDRLTQLMNRTAFEEQTGRYRSSQNGAGGKLIVMMTDVNGLKQINDTYGHAAGDEAIVRIAELLRARFGEKGLCYRIGGDEFCVFMEGEAPEDFRKRMEAYIEEAGRQVIGCGRQLSAAAGFVECERQEIDRALIEADREMYQCKNRMKEFQNA